MKVGDQLTNFYLFNVLTKGEVYQVNKDKTVGVVAEGYKYPNVRTFKTLPKRKKEVPPWYILK